MRAVSGCRRGLPLLLSAVCVSLLVGCPTTSSDDFVSISEHGFNSADNAQDLNDYPWGMAYFAPDGADVGQLYVATGNNILQQGLASMSPAVSAQPVYRPPEIRRYRPDLGEKAWERVFDYRDVESGPEWETSGFRSMAVYHAQADDVTYLYAGTVGLNPAVWRSPSGEPGAWERVWTDPSEGSVRAMTAHNGLLYVAVSHDQHDPALPGEVYATDGETFWLVAGEGLGNPENTGIYSLASFDGWLYAGTANRLRGYEVWKLEGPGGGAPVQVVAGGGPSRSNQSTSQMLVFQERLYVGALIYGGLNLYGFPLRGADMIRIDRDDNVETVVGPGSLGGVDSGFGDVTNPYLWSLAAHDGKLYCGTWDSAGVLPAGLSHLPEAMALLAGNVLKPRRGPYDMLTDNGAELYVSNDGVYWEPVFTDGLGNPDNYGVRNMVSADGRLYLGMANPTEGLEIWCSR